jgi:hypothetical protein
VSAACAIGDERRLAGYALAGVEVRHALTGPEVDAAWAGLAEDAGLLILTPDAHAALEGRLFEREGLVWAVLPWA